MRQFYRQLQHSYGKALKHYWESINRALKNNVVRQNCLNSGPLGFWKDCCPCVSNRFMICPQRSSVSIFVFIILLLGAVRFAPVRVWGTARLCFWASTVLNIPRSGGKGLWLLVTLEPLHVWNKAECRCWTETMNKLVSLSLRKVSQYGPTAVRGSPTGSSNSADHHQRTSVVHFRLLKFVQPLYCTLFLFLSLQLPPFFLSLPTLCFSSHVWGPAKVNRIWWSGGGRRGRFARHGVSRAGVSAAREGSEEFRKGK